MRESAFDVVSIPARMKVLARGEGTQYPCDIDDDLRVTYDICARSSSSGSFSESLGAFMLDFTACPRSAL